MTSAPLGAASSQRHSLLVPSAPFPHLFSLPAPLPPPKEVINGNIKTVTEYKIDEDGKKFKVRLGEEVGAPGLGGIWAGRGGRAGWVGWPQDP